MHNLFERVFEFVCTVPTAFCITKAQGSTQVHPTGTKQQTVEQIVEVPIPQQVISLVTLFKRTKKIALPCSDGSLKFTGKRFEVPTSDLSRQDPKHEAENCSGLEGETDNVHAAKQQREQNDSNVRDGFWRISGNLIHRHDVQERVMIYEPKESSFPVPLKNVCCCQADEYDIGRITRKSD